MLSLAKRLNICIFLHIVATRKSWSSFLSLVYQPSVHSCWNIGVEVQKSVGGVSNSGCCLSVDVTARIGLVI